MRISRSVRYETSTHQRFIRPRLIGCTRVALISAPVVFARVRRELSSRRAPLRLANHFTRPRIEIIGGIENDAALAGANIMKHGAAAATGEFGERLFGRKTVILEKVLSRIPAAHEFGHHGADNGIGVA
jgi:hypothetical protein